MMHSPKYRMRNAGLTLVELLVSLGMSLLVVAAASSFFLGSSRSRATQDDAGQLQDNARFATEMITKSIQQSGYQNYVYGTAGAANRREVAAASDGEPDIRGYNNTAAGTSTNNGAHDTPANRINNSDTLVVRYQGSGTPADGSMIDCLGRSQAASTTPGDRSFSIFEVRQTTGSAEPELRCKYFNVATGSFSVEPIVRGVETLQFLYGVDTNGDSFVDRWMNAAEVSPTGSTTVVADWSRVRSVRVGMVLRSPNRVAVTTGTGTATQVLSPLGVNFSQNVNDTLTVNPSDGRLRKVVTFTVNLRTEL